MPSQRGRQQPRQSPRAPPDDGRLRRGKSPSDSDSRRAPHLATINGAAARTPAIQIAAARPARRRSRAPRRRGFGVTPNPAKPRAGCRRCCRRRRRRAGLAVSPPRLLSELPREREDGARTRREREDAAQRGRQGIHLPPCPLRGTARFMTRRV